MENTNLPTHVGIIMDGNGRWAKAHGVPRVMGHNAGMQAMKKIVIASSEMGIKYLTVYAFSTENWKRSTEEVSGIFNLIVKYVNLELEELDEAGALQNVSHMPARVKCAMLGWRTLETLLKEDEK